MCLPARAGAALTGLAGPEAGSRQDSAWLIRNLLRIGSPASLVAVSASNRDIVVVICAAEDSRRDVFEGWSVRLVPRTFHAAPTVTTPPVLRLGHAVAKFWSKASCPTHDPTRVLSPGQFGFAFALVRSHTGGPSERHEGVVDLLAVGFLAEGPLAWFCRGTFRRPWLRRRTVLEENSRKRRVAASPASATIAGTTWV